MSITVCGCCVAQEERLWEAFGTFRGALPRQCSSFCPGSEEIDRSAGAHCLVSLGSFQLSVDAPLAWGAIGGVRSAAATFIVVATHGGPSVYTHSLAPVVFLSLFPPVCAPAPLVSLSCSPPLGGWGGVAFRSRSWRLGRSG